MFFHYFFIFMQQNSSFYRYYLLNKCIFSVIFINLIKYYPIKYQILHPIL